MYYRILINMITEDDVVYLRILTAGKLELASFVKSMIAGRYRYRLSCTHLFAPCPQSERWEQAKAGCFLRLKPGSHMPPMHMRHGRRYCLGYCSENRSSRQHSSSKSLPPAYLRGWLKFNFAGMPAVKLCDGSSCRRRMFSFVREVSQAVLAATSQIHRRHMRTSLNDCLHVDVSYFLYCVPFPRATKEIRDVCMHSGKLMITSSAFRARSVELHSNWVELTGAPNDNFRKISVRKTIWDLEFS